MTSAMSCSIEQHRGVELVADAADERAERLGLALREAGGRLVEQQHARAERELARELGDPARAGREVRHELVGEPLEADVAHDLVRLARASSVQREVDGGSANIDDTTPVRPRASSATKHRLAHGEVVVEARGLEAATEAEPAPGGTAAAR